MMGTINYIRYDGYKNYLFENFTVQKSTSNIIWNGIEKKAVWLVWQILLCHSKFLQYFAELVRITSLK